MGVSALPGVLLMQLGTPDAPTPSALRTYLRQFLSDRRVVDVSRPLWWLILNGIVLPTRPARSAKLYQKVWTPEGSPLALTTAAQAAGLADELQALTGCSVPVEVAMRYGRPSTADALRRLLDRGCDRILAFPLYPQYASPTTGSSLEELFRIAGAMRVVPPVRVVPPYFDDPAYMDALVSSARRHFAEWEPDHIVLSFHGLPQRYASLGDPYPEHCRATAAAFATKLGWPADRLTLSFQSRFGREPWLQPYTDATLLELASRRIPRLAVLCPGFVTDCLETIEEIGLSGREAYHAAGGGEFRLIPCLNTDPAWLAGLGSIASRELAGWV